MEADVSVPVDYPVDWHYAHGGPLGSCRFKSHHEDFLVAELLPFEPEGDGEHLFLLVEKRGENTDWVAGLLARYAGVGRQSVSYAGRKDRHGVTRQWFCVSLPGKADPNWSGLESDTIRIISQARHRKKLKTGALRANDFVITLRDITVDSALVDARLALIAREGVPNYFGEQRFGQQGRNIAKAADMLAGKFRVQRNKRSMYLSAARSWLFNRVLSGRVADGVWNQYLAGDVLGFPDNSSLIFEAPDEAMLARVAQGQLSPTSSLWGRGRPGVTDQSLALEQTALAGYQPLCDGLERVGLNQERRVNRLIPTDMSWSWADGGATLALRFRLGKGCFATSLLRELFVCCEPARYEDNRQVSLETAAENDCAE